MKKIISLRFVSFILSLLIFIGGYAITAYGSANGTSGGTTSTSAGNIYVSEFNGAANQLWKIESGGIQLNNGQNIKTATTKDKKSENSGIGQFFCPVTEFGETVSWSSNNARSVSITSNGTATTVKAGTANITATVTHTNGTTTTYSCTIYVVIQNGVYCFHNVETGYRIEYEDPSDYSEGAVMEVYDSSDVEDEEVPNYAMFKIKYLGSGKYSIRSMLRNDMGWTFSSDSELVMTNIGTSDSQIDNSEKWNIAYDSRGYYIYNHSKLSTITAPDDIDDNNIYGYRYAEFDDLQHWTLTKITDSINGVAICDKVSVLPVGETSKFAAAVYSTNMYHNGQNGYTWSITSGSQYASINATTGVLTAVAPGSVTVKATYKSTTWYATYTFRIVPIPDGTYFFRNVEYDDKYMQINQNVSSDTDGAHMEIFSFDSGADQRWKVTHIGSGYYKINSYVSGYALTAPSQNNGSITQTEYDPSNNAQKWIITIVGDGSYKLSPLSDTSSYMAVSGSWGGENGRNVEKRANQSDGKDEWTLHRMLPLSGYEIEYDPDSWNTDDIQPYNNCYLYALNGQNSEDNNIYCTQPGEESDISIFYYTQTETNNNIPIFKMNIENASAICDAVMADSASLDFLFRNIGKYDTCPEGSYKIALVMDFYDNPNIDNTIYPYGTYCIEEPDIDYHWYRQNPDGTWSHKPGRTEVTNLDASEELIFDPEICDRNYETSSGINYNEFIGYFAVTPLDN